MLLAVSCFVLLSLSYAQHRTRCGVQSEVGTTLKETGDGVEGRYTVEWCWKLEDTATEWNFELDYVDYHNGTTQCPENDTILTSVRLKRYLLIHSVFTERLERPFLCNITCLSKPLDLVFSGCYVAQSQLARSAGRRSTWRRSVSSLRVDNRFGSAQAFNDMRPFYEIARDGDTLIVKWDLHYIPVSDYEMKVTRYDKNDTDVKNPWVPIENNCTHETFSIACRLHAPQDGGCVAASLIHNVPWRRGQLFRDANIMRYCAPERKQVRLSRAGSGSGWDARAWWAAGALLLALAALAACWAAHTRLLAELRKRVLHQWTHRYSRYGAGAEAGAEAGAGAGAGAGAILLLYARDCAPAAAAVAVLKEMLEAGAPGKVYDLFAAECMSQYAASPGEWLRSVLARRDVAVLLVQTPAAAALYGAQADDDTLNLQEPLLGSRVQYRRPHYGDALLQYALRLVRDTAHMQQEYTKYYIATISELSADALPAVAPYRRYVLPAHASRLLADLRLAPDADTTRRLAQLAAAVDELVRYVRGNENYLRDELMFL